MSRNRKGEPWNAATDLTRYSAWLTDPMWENPYSPHTIRSYLTAAAHFHLYMTHEELDTPQAVNSAWVRAYMRRLSDNHSKTTVNQRIIALAKYFEYLIEIGQYTGVNPVFQAKAELKRKRGGLSSPKRLPSILHDHERKWLFEVLTQNFTENLQKLAIIGLFLDSGVRVSELTALTAIDLENLFQTGMLTVIGKGNKERIIKPLSHYRSFLTEYWQVRPTNTHIAFPTPNHTHYDPSVLYRWVSRLLKECGIQKPQSGPHLLRHTAASLMLRAGYSLVQVQNYLGHRSITVTDRYLHLIQ